MPGPVWPEWRMPTDFTSLFATLAAAGGLACILHGVDRTTADVDLVVDLAADSVRSTIAALVGTGYRPMAPVDPAHLADPVVRQRWQQEHGMQVFSLWDGENRRPTVDILLEGIVPFEELLADSVAMTLRGTTVAVASIEHLIRLKRHAGRPQDLADITRLTQLAQRHRPA